MPRIFRPIHLNKLPNLYFKFTNSQTTDAPNRVTDLTHANNSCKKSRNTPFHHHEDTSQMEFILPFNIPLKSFKMLYPIAVPNLPESEFYPLKRPINSKLIGASLTRLATKCISYPQKLQHYVLFQPVYPLRHIA